MRRSTVLIVLIAVASCVDSGDPRTGMEGEGGAGAGGTGHGGEPSGGSGEPPVAGTGVIPGTAGASGGSGVAGTNAAGGTNGAAGNAQVPVVIAQGYVGRTTVSCDDGKTWIANRSFDIEGHDLVCGDKTPVRCQQTSCTNRWTDGGCSKMGVCDCVHGTGYGKGVAIARNQILAVFGWGYPGAVLRSFDGGKFQDVLPLDMALYPNILFGTDRFVLYTGFDPLVSDDGATWRHTTPPNSNEGGRASAFLDAHGGRFIAVQDGNIIRVSADRGETWHRAASVPAGCTNGIGSSQTILAGNGIAAMISFDDRTACRSADGGETWTLHKITAKTNGIFFQSPVFANGKFLTWAVLWPATNGTRFSSADGMAWTETTTNGAIWLGSTGVTTAGTLVATNGDQYEKQGFSRSTDDGLTWTGSTSFVKSHAITRFAAGLVEANTICPGR